MTFTFHQRAGWGSVVACIAVLIAAETLGVHIFLMHRSRIAAWTVTLSDLWVIVWLIRDHRAMRRQPTTIDENALHFRFGLRWSATIDRANIVSIEPPRNESDWKRKDVVKASLLDDPKLMLRLREPVVANGPFGIKRPITALALTPDDPAGFVAALS